MTFTATRSPQQHFISVPGNVSADTQVFFFFVAVINNYKVFVLLNMKNVTSPKLASC